MDTIQNNMAKACRTKCQEMQHHQSEISTQTSLQTDHAPQMMVQAAKSLLVSLSHCPHWVVLLLLLRFLSGPGTGENPVAIPLSGTA
jgi:hypothetical protein